MREVTIATDTDKIVLVRLNLREKSEVRDRRRRKSQPWSPAAMNRPDNTICKDIPAAWLRDGCFVTA
jgi:hypothetical protein